MGVKIRSLLEACFDLISGSFLHISSASHENSNHRRENYWKSGVQIPAPEGQNLSFILFIFKFSIKICISLFFTIFEYLVSWITRESPPSAGLRLPFGSGRGGNYLKILKFFNNKHMFFTSFLIDGFSQLSFLVYYIYIL